MIRLTRDDIILRRLPGLTGQPLALAQRGLRLARRAIRQAGGTSDGLEVLIADTRHDLVRGSEFLRSLSLEACLIDEWPMKADSVQKAKHWRHYEMTFGPVIVLMPNDRWLPKALQDSFRLGHAVTTEVECGAFVDTLRQFTEGQERPIRWARLRPSAGGFDLRVRLCGAVSREVRTHLPHKTFPDGSSLAQFVREAVGTAHII